MRRTYLVLLALVLLPRLASAQSHPCDTAPPTTFTVAAGSIAVDVCFDDKDTSGAAAVPTGWNLLVDGVRQAVTMAKTTPTANSVGLFNYHGTSSLASGSHTCNVEVLTSNGLGGTQGVMQTVPFTCKGSAAPPHPPTNGRIS